MIGYETCMEIGIDYEDFIIKLNIHDCVGFEQYIASHLLEDYVTKYNTKGDLNSISGMFRLNRLYTTIPTVVIVTRLLGLFIQSI